MNKMTQPQFEVDDSMELSQEQIPIPSLKWIATIEKTGIPFEMGKEKKIMLNSSRGFEFNFETVGHTSGEKKCCR